ncbi:hypothetical protein J5N97_016355 [Dioscorea zingiberensis]|uniref:CAAX prenyl protease 2/Lysostaphin resistance protein A-like domain-containing protein n=1 Tax=Dioscorea zingiberensis TaxID=325984 RepID=A0A9D5CJT9_9LILI|nr:hypothetical protein J5N97_016355 [Dioscorea zingiberensis]
MAHHPLIPSHNQSDAIMCAIPSFHVCNFHDFHQSRSSQALRLFAFFLSRNFSALETNTPWDSSDIWSTLAGYIFALHIPLSFGGVSFVAQTLKSSPDPFTMVASIIVLQMIEFLGAMVLLNYTAKTEYHISSFFIEKLFSEKRSSIKASATGVVFLIGSMLLTSIIVNNLIEPKVWEALSKRNEGGGRSLRDGTPSREPHEPPDVSNPIMKEMIFDSPLSKTATAFLLCFTTPLLEETIYRGFLLTCLAKEMKWWEAIIISASVFSIAHFSIENSLQLSLVGTILGSVYCWSGNLAAPFVVHSVYNAAILLLTYMS